GTSQIHATPLYSFSNEREQILAGCQVSVTYNFIVGGETSMNQKIIDVELKSLEDDTDILEFQYEDNPLPVNLNSDATQNELKAVFERLLQELMLNDVALHFKYAEAYKRGMFIEVCEEYVKDLNRELKNVKERLLENM
ncbi:hypothetical protein, partial [Eubacterium pyruvativorans]|uniref:hypothetical protein n=1 Tax=Eubacterium pyruvativorans TaxID=155865 RepID=UPI003F89A5C3